MNLLMKFFRPQKWSETQDKNDNSTIGSAGSSFSSIKISEKGKQTSKKTRSKSYRKGQKKARVQETPNEQLAALFIETMNYGATKEDFLAFFMSGNSRIQFDDTEGIPFTTAESYCTEAEKACKCFPDLTFKCESIKEIKPGRVLVEDLVVSGTHTGAPYGFGPFPPIETSNKRCVNDPERMWFTIKDGKFVKMEVVALGTVTGPPGFYIQIGGDMTQPPPELAPAAEDESDN